MWEAILALLGVVALGLKLYMGRKNSPRAKLNEAIENAIEKRRKESPEDRAVSDADRRRRASRLLRQAKNRNSPKT